MITLDELQRGVADAGELLEMAAAENDEGTVAELVADLDGYEGRLETLEFRRMFSGEMDTANAYLDVQSGSGGTEAQDWAEMLLRMYSRWGERRGFTVELMERSDGEVAGIKSATLFIQGDYAYGWLRSETGVHRLVRKSPFDSGNRRHTSFCGVFVSPEVHLPLLRCRRPARQQDRVGDPHQARAQRHCGGLSDGAQPARQPRPCHEHAQGQAL